MRGLTTFYPDCQIDGACKVVARLPGKFPHCGQGLLERSLGVLHFGLRGSESSVPFRAGRTAPPTDLHLE